MSIEDDRKDKHVGRTKTRSAVEGNIRFWWRCVAAIRPPKFDQFIVLMHLTSFKKDFDTCTYPARTPPNGLQVSAAYDI